MYKYLLILEDTTVIKLKEISEEDMINSDDGVCMIIRLSDLKFHVEGDIWEDLKDNLN